ncbi:hypothetical protein F1737_11175 [Methanoplanus sp. FWC-SCC4]|uniref:Uncharacterized protein n=1 Tax=Methanochimaera problematica TaxID=2609417 RepID=A0AA97I4R1_9EURY|nr:hypothetical protein [Methanoplanus sp. FWC-SCC4]WOF17201.1 hypothetical protein F1737_11175 [Methanoplanus sp. FWC-SCC4]
MRKSITIFLLIALLALGVQASSAESQVSEENHSEWMKIISVDDGQLSSIWQLSDGSFVAGGSDANGRLLIGMTDTGDIAWKKNIPGGDENGTVRFVESSPSGGLYLFTDGENLIKTDMKGDVEWTYHQAFGVVTSVEITQAGDVLLGGDYYQSFLTMVGKDGAELWNRSLGGPESGGQFRITSAQSVQDNGFIIAGYVSPIIAGGEYTGFILRIDNEGNQIWANQYKGDDAGFILTITPSYDDGFVAGRIKFDEASLSIKKDETPTVAYLMFMDSEGKVTEEKPMPGLDMIYYITKGPENSYYLLGLYHNSVTDRDEFKVLRTNSKGNIIWEKPFENTKITSVKTTSDSGIILAGIDENTNQSIIIKMDAKSDAKDVPGFGFISGLFAMTAAGLFVAVRRK